MAAEITPNRSKIGLLALALILLAAVGWYWFQNTARGGVDYRMAIEAQAEMEVQKAAANEVGSATAVAEIYASAVSYEERGDQEFARGDYTAARTNYIEASGFYIQARLAVASSTPTPVAEENPSAIADLAQITVRKIQREADQAGADPSASPAYQQALTELQRGNSAYAATDYAAAAAAFDAASELFRTARNQANQQKLAGSENLSDIRNAVTALRDEMIVEKETAARAQSVIWAEAEWGTAQEKEQAGDRNFGRNNKEGYLAAQAAYAEAKDGYVRAAEQAAIAVAAEQAREEQARRTAQLADAAESARETMQRAKQAVSGTEAEKTASPGYQSANRAERSATTAFGSQAYAKAKTDYDEATSLYRRAASEIEATRRATPDPTPPPTTPDPAPQPAAPDTQQAQADAETGIAALVREFESSLENTNLTALTQLREDRGNWSMFFENVENIQVRTVIDRQEIDLTENTARVSFRVVLSFSEKGKSKTQRNDFSRDWRLQRIGDGWVVVSSNKQ